MTGAMQKRSYASVKRPIPATMIALKWYHCIRAVSSDDNTFIGIVLFLICDSESRVSFLFLFCRNSDEVKQDNGSYKLSHNKSLCFFFCVILFQWSWNMPLVILTPKKTWSVVSLSIYVVTMGHNNIFCLNFFQHIKPDFVLIRLIPSLMNNN